MTTLTLSQIETDLERRHMWMCLTSQAELKKHAIVWTYTAHIMSKSRVIVTARAADPNAARRAAYELLIAKEQT